VTELSNVCNLIVTHGIENIVVFEALQKMKNNNLISHFCFFSSPNSGNTIRIHCNSYNTETIFNMFEYIYLKDDGSIYVENFREL